MRKQYIPGHFFPLPRGLGTANELPTMLPFLLDVSYQMMYMYRKFLYMHDLHEL